MRTHNFVIIMFMLTLIDTPTGASQYRGQIASIGLSIHCRTYQRLLVSSARVRESLGRALFGCARLKLERKCGPGKKHEGEMTLRTYHPNVTHRLCFVVPSSAAHGKFKYLSVDAARKLCKLRNTRMVKRHSPICSGSPSYIFNMAHSN